MMTLMVLELMQVRKNVRNNERIIVMKENWTFPVQGISKNDITIIKDGSNYTNFTVN